MGPQAAHSPQSAHLAAHLYGPASSAGYPSPVVSASAAAVSLAAGLPSPLLQSLPASMMASAAHLSPSTALLAGLGHAHRNAFPPAPPLSGRSDSPESE